MSASRSASPLEDQVWLDSGFELLRRKWRVIPGDVSRRLSSEDLLRVSTDELVRTWTRLRDADVEGPGFRVRGWYHELYREFMRGKKVLDIGCGFGISSISFAQMGAEVTFVDIVDENVQLVEKVCRGLGLIDHTHFKFLERISDLETLPTDYDVVTALGSLHNAPFEFMRKEAIELVKHLKVGGRWLQLAYPKVRWLREGSPPFSKWGEMTDGEGTPYCEWYDLEKLLRLLAPAQFRPLLEHEWHNKDFNWFDLLLVSHDGFWAMPSPPEEKQPILEEELAALRAELRSKEEALARFEPELRESQVLLDRLRAEAATLRENLTAVEASAGWRLVTGWRRVRDRIAPNGTLRRRLYDRLRLIPRSKH